MCSFKFLKRQPNNRQGLKYLRRLAIEILRSLRCLWHDSIGSFNTSYSNSKEEMEVANTVKPHEGELRASNEDFDEDWLRRFLERGVQVKNRTKKTPVTECLVCCVCVLFSMAKSMLLNGLCSFLDLTQEQNLNWYHVILVLQLFFLRSWKFSMVH